MMKSFYVLILVFLLSLGCHAQQSPNPLNESYETIFRRQEIKLRELWEAKEYRKSIGILQDLRVRYEQLEAKEKDQYVGALQGLAYNLSCAYSLVHQVDSSILYLQLALDNGYRNYYRIKNDSDLDPIREDQRYLDLMKTHDFESLLKQNCTYKKQSAALPVVAFQSKDAAELKALREKYRLEAVAGNGSEVSRIINLMRWVHKEVRHEGSSPNPIDRRADALIELCNKENRGVNCRMMATILNEVYLSMGYPSHVVTCLPMDKMDTECHVINSVFSKELNKWLWMDPTFETWVQDEKGYLLGIEEVRRRLVDEQPVFASSSINHNGMAYAGGSDEYLHNYMAKNLFQFQIPSVSCCAFESRTEAEIIQLIKPTPVKKFYIQLIPSEFSHDNVPMGRVVNEVVYTNDEGQFWRGM